MKRLPLRGKELQKSIIATARRQGWRVGHFPTIQDAKGIWRTPVAAQGKGFPDLLLLRERIVVAEIKGDGDTVKQPQKEWLQAFQDAGVETYVWRPADWRSGAIDEVLK